MTCTLCPVSLRRGEHALFPSGDGPIDPARWSSLQELAFVRVLLGGLLAEMLARTYPPRGRDNRCWKD